jgi:hypothetical protein
MDLWYILFLKCVVNWLHLLWSGHQSSEQSPNVLFLLELFVGSLGAWKMFRCAVLGSVELYILNIFFSGIWSCAALWVGVMPPASGLCNFDLAFFYLYWSFYSYIIVTVLNHGKCYFVYRYLYSHYSHISSASDIHSYLKNTSRNLGTNMSHAIFFSFKHYDLW